MRGHSVIHHAATWCCVILFACMTHAQEGWSVEQITAESGLPQNSVRSMAMDSSGYLWMTTEGGLVRYDGRNMRVFSTRNDTDLVDDRLSHLLSDRAGTLYANDPTGVLYRVGTTDIVRVPDTRGPAGLFRLISGGLPSLEVYRSIVRRPSKAHAGGWLNWDTRLVPLPSGGWAVASGDSLYLFPAHGPVVAFAARMDRYGLFLAGNALVFLGRDKVFRCVDPEQLRITELSVKGVDPRSLDRILWTFSAQHVIAIGPEGLWRMVSCTDTEITFEAMGITLPPNTYVNDALLTADGTTLFMGTSTHGLFRYTRQRFRTDAPTTGTSDGEDHAFYAQALLGGERVLTSKGGVCGPGGFEPDPYPGGPFAYHVLHRDGRGRIWTVRADSACTRDAATGKRLWCAPSTAGIISVLLEEDDTLWAAGSRGLEAWVNDTPVAIVKRMARDHRDGPFALARGPDGSLWLATGNGVLRLEGRALIPVPGLERAYVRALFAWRGRMLLGTYGEGPLVYDKGRVVRLPLDARGALSHVHAFIPDSLGRLWMPTNHGLVVVDEAALEAFLADPTGIVPYRSFGRQDGLSTLEFNGGCSPPYVRLPSGAVSVPTIDGLVRFRPEHILTENGAFLPVVDELYLNDRVVPVAAPLVRSVGRADRLVLHLALPWWGTPSDLRLMYRVLGLDERWVLVDMGTDRITMERLPPGDYVVQVMPAGHPEQVRELMVLSVKAPWYLHGWVLVCGALLLVVAVWWLLRVRTEQLLRARERLEAIVDERTEELRDSNRELTHELNVKDRLISILSHDIVSPLRFISRVATRTLSSARSEKPEVLRHTLAEISTSSEKLYANASNILEWIRNQGGRIAVDPVPTEVHAFVDEVLAQFQQHASTVRFINAVPNGEVLSVDPRLLGIVLQNLIANAAGHAGGQVVLEGRRVPDGYRITVKDNGPGMSTVARQRIEALRKGTSDDRLGTDRPGLGYMIIHDVLALLGGHYAIETPAEGGTWVHVQLPDLPVTSGAMPVSER